MTNAQLITADSLDVATGAAEAYLLEQVGRVRPLVLTVGDGAGGYEVVRDRAGAASGADPKAAATLYFDGPVSQAQYDAGAYAAEHRIEPATEQLPGVIRTLTLWEPQARSMTIVILAESLDALDAAARAVDGTALLPGEEPALLPGPDRADVHHVSDSRRDLS